MEVIFISVIQFGYSSDNYYQCKYLSNHFQVTVICPDRYLPPVELAGVKVNYLDLNAKGILKSISFLIQLIKFIRSSYKNHTRYFFVAWFKFAFILPILIKKHRFSLDIRSGGVSPGFFSRNLRNLNIFLTTFFFKEITIISESLARRFLLKTYHLLPLGADVISDSKKVFDRLRLIYVGTLNGRKISETVNGIALFKKYHPGISVKYTIIGNGTDKETKKLKETINHFKLNDDIEFIGRKNHEELREIFSHHNIGVLYLPQKRYYDPQPPTKLFEYTLSGLAVISTGTYENKRYMNDNNGVVIDDNPESFSAGLIELQNSLSKYDSRLIRESFRSFQWENIVENYLIPFVKSQLDTVYGTNLH